MVKEELYIGGYVVELLGSLNPNLTFNIADVSKPDSRNADHSKTIELPASKLINQIFEHIFELSSDLQTFNPNLKTDVIYLVDGEIQIDGYLQLKSIKDIKGQISYNCIIIGRVGNFIADMQNAKLSDLDLSSLNHVWNKANQAATWNLPLTTDYVYPMINYDVNYGTLNSGTENWPVSTLFPAVKAKKYLDLIFASIGYTYTSTFLDNSFFNTLIIPFSQADFKLSETEVLTRLFEVNDPEILSTGNDDVNVTNTAGVYNDNYAALQSEFINFNIEVNDPSNLYNNTIGIYEVAASKSGFYNIETMLQLQGEFTAPSDAATLNWNCQSAICGYIKINKYDANGNFISTLDSINYGVTSGNQNAGAGGTVITEANPTSNTLQYFYHIEFINYIASKQLMAAAPNTYLNQNATRNKFYVNANNIYLNAGEKIKIELDYGLFLFYRAYSPTQDPANKVFGQWVKAGDSWSSTGTAYKLNILSGYLTNTVVNSGLVEGNPIDMSSMTPRNIKQKDFIMSLVKMFNLYIQPDTQNNKNLIIEPRDDFYSNVVTDWSSKLDKFQDIESKPMGALNFKEYLYTYKQDKDYYNELYFDTWGEVYGQDDFTLANQFLKNKHKTEIIFSPTPSVGQDWYDRVLPTIIKYDDTNGVQRTESNIRILQWGGMLSTDQSWNHTNDAGTATSYSTYPYAGMYDDPYTPTEILEFGLTNEIYYSNGFNRVITFTNNGLFNKYYSKFIQEITDTNSKIVTGYFYLSPSDIKNLSFSSQYYFEGQYFRLSKIENYNPINPITKCEFLKIKLSNVFQAGGTIGNGGVDLLIANDKVPTFSNGNQTLKHNNSLGNLSQNVVGSNNYISRSARGIKIIGDSNTVNANARNVEINGSNNIINAGASNVKLINSDNQNVISSNITYINNEITAGAGSTVTVTNADIVASLNVQNYFCKTDGEDNITITFSTTESITIGKIWLFKKLGSENRVIIDAESIGTTIDGSESHTLTANNKYVSIQWNGTEFLIISNN